MTEHRAHLQAGLDHHRAGRLAEAQDCYHQVSQNDPACADAWNLLGVIEQQRGQSAAAVELISRASELDPSRWEFLSNLGCAYQDLGDYQAAARAHAAARDLAPERPQLWSNWASALYQQGQVDEAAKAWHRAIQLEPGHAEAYYNLGNLYRESNRASEAAQCYRRCLKTNPQHRLAFENLTALWLAQGKLDQVLEACARASQGQPEWAEPWYRAGLAHKGRGDLPLALAAYDQALARAPQAAEIRFARSLVQWQRGDRSAALPDWESRWFRGGLSGRPALDWPQWRGQPLAGKKILIWGELAADDELAFSGCLPAVVSAARHTVIECEPRLVPLLRRSFPTATVNARAESPTYYRPRGSEPFDFQAPLGDLPCWLPPGGRATENRSGETGDADSASTTGWLRPDRELRLRNRERLAELGPGLTVGLAWRDPPRAWGVSDLGSKLADWLPLLSLPGVHWVNLQPGTGRQVFEQLNQQHGIEVREWFDQDLVNHLDPLAGRLAAVDLVITVPSTVAHLTGALGLEAWVVVPRGAEWYWGTTDQCEWYPSLKLFRQQSENWSALLARLRAALAERIAAWQGAEPGVVGAQRPPGSAPPDSRVCEPIREPLSQAVTKAQQRAQAGQADEALVELTALVQQHPDCGELRYQCGALALKHKKSELAITHLVEAAQLLPGSPFARFYLAAAYADRKRTHDAIDVVRQAVALKPDFPEAHLNLGAYLERLSRYDEALIHASRAAELMPKSASVFYNLANVRLHLGHLEEALKAYQQSLDLDPTQPKAHWNRSVALLLLRRFEQGWPEWEYREAAGEVIVDKFDEPTWNGCSLAGKTLLYHAEQGVGDEIMFASCLPDLIQEAAHVVINCEPRLESLMRRSFPGTTVCPVRRPLKEPWRPPVPVDLTVTAGSVPRYLRPTIESFPRTAYLVPDPAQVAWWREQFAARGQGLRVGISWRAGGKANEQKRRTAALEDWGRILRLPGIDWINLQYGDCTEELAWARRELGVDIHDFAEGDPLKDLDGFAARVAALDLVFSIGNTTIHMAGAVGTPTWVVLPQVPGWRYMVEGDDLLWYGCVRLFRQLRPDDWTGLFAHMADRLQAWVDANAGLRRERAEQPRQPRSSGQAVRSAAAAAPVALPKATPRTLFLDGLRHQRLGQPAEAERCYRQVIAHHPDHTDALQLLGLILLGQGDHQQAIELMQRSLAINEAQGLVHYNLGTAWEAAGKPQQAIAAYERAIELEPTLAEAHLNLGVALQKRRDLEAAKECFRRALAVRPRYAEAHNNLGFALLASGQAEQALERFDQALTLRSDYPECRRSRARALAQLGRTELAAEAYQQLLAEFPGDTAIRDELAALRPQAPAPHRPAVVPAPHLGRLPQDTHYEATR